MQNAKCHPDMQRFWQLLAEGYCTGQQQLTTLRLIQKELSPEPMGIAAAALEQDVAEGRMLSEAMNNQPSVFSRAHVSLVEGGERLGIVDRIVLLILEQTWKCPTCGNLQFPGETG